MQFREAIERDAQDLRDLADRASIRLDGLPTGSKGFGEQERQLDTAAMVLRREWLEIAHRPADRSLKSPREGKVAHLAHGETVCFGYERDLDVAVLEGRGETYVTAPAGWSADLVLCRSGQAALACILNYAVARWGEDRSLTVGHAGAYFETASLLKSWPQRVLRKLPAESAEIVDILVAEPVWCDGRFGCAERAPRVRRVMVIDTTMVGPGHDLERHLPAPGEDCSLMIAYSSGLKLDQAGLELANVGIVRILARDGCDDAATVGAALRGMRGLTGSGLTLDELSALSAPWFMDRAYVDRYTAAIFANNRALAAAVGTDSAVFGGECHPSLLSPASDGPFCAFELIDGSAEQHQRLASIIERESERRGLVANRGGSFGFRGHRFEAIEPDPGQGRPFLRVAMGWRDGHSRHGFCEMFGEFAGHPSVEALLGAYR